MPADACPDVDLALFQDLAEALGHEELVEVVAVFLRETDHHLRMIVLAAATGDAARVARVAHAIKGSASTLALSPLARAAHDLEQAALGGEAAGALIEVAQDAFRAARGHLDMLLRGQPPGQREGAEGLHRHVA